MAIGINQPNTNTFGPNLYRAKSKADDRVETAMRRWNSHRVNRIEADTYGSEFAARIISIVTKKCERNVQLNSLRRSRFEAHR